MAYVSQKETIYMTKIRKPIVDRFWPRVNKSTQSGCWEWTGALSSAGYGQIGAQGERKIIYTHRLSWELRNGPIGAGVVILHSCDNPKCCNPDHLQAGTQLENMRDCRRKGRDVHSQSPNCFPIGQRAARAKLSDAQATEMIQMVKNGVTRAEAAGKFNVSVSLISKILNKKCREKSLNNL